MGETTDTCKGNYKVLRRLPGCILEEAIDKEAYVSENHRVSGLSGDSSGNLRRIRMILPF